MPRPGIGGRCAQAGSSRALPTELGDGGSPAVTAPNGTTERWHRMTDRCSTEVAPNGMSLRAQLSVDVVGCQRVCGADEDERRLRQPTRREQGPEVGVM